MKTDITSRRKSLSFSSVYLILLFLFFYSCKGIIFEPDTTFKNYQFKEVAGLHFKAKKFTPTDSTASATGDVWVGLPPKNGQFTPLLSISKGISIKTKNDPQFTSLGSTAIKGAAAIPVFSNPITININDVLNEGVSLTGNSLKVHGLDFSLETLAIADSTGLGPLIKLQGDLSITQLDSLNIAVEGQDYVIINPKGVDLTGLDVSLLPTDTFRLAEVSFIPQSMNFQFQKADSIYELSGAGEIIADHDTINIVLGEKSSNTPGLEIKNGEIEDFDISISQDKSFHLKGLEFDPEALNLAYKAAGPTYEMSGKAKAIVQSDTIKIDAGSPSKPGLEIRDGKIDQINFHISQGDTFSILGLHIDPKSLTFDYKRSDDYYKIGGDISIIIGVDTVDVNLNDLEIQDGVVDTLSIAFTTALSVGGLKFDTKDLTIDYDKSDARYEITGLVQLPDLFNATVSFPGKGIEIVDGKWELDGFKFEVEDVPLDVFEIKDLAVKYEKTSESYDLDIRLSLQFPGGFGVAGSIDFQNGHIQEVSLDVTNIIPIGDSGVSLYTIGAGLNNLDSPRNLVVSGDIGLTLGDAEIDTLAFKAFSSFTADREMLRLEGQVQASFDVEGTVIIILNWQNGTYKIITDWVLYEIFDIDLAFSINEQLFITMMGEVDLQIPNEIPIIGGDVLAQAGFYFQRHLETPIKESDDFAAGWGKILWSEVGIKVPFKDPKNFKIIGSTQIDSIQHSKSQSRSTYKYTSISNVPEGVTHLLLHATWPESINDQQISITLPNDTTIYAADFSEENGIYLDPSRSNENMATILIRNPPPDTLRFDTMPHGQYQLHLATATEFPGDSISLHSRYFIPKPSLQIDSIKVPENDTIAIVYFTPKSTSLAEEVQVGLFLDYDPSGFDGAFAVGKDYTPETFLVNTEQADSLIISIKGMLPQNYYVYGIIKDQINIPDTSSYSAFFTPSPSLYGTINNDQTGTTYSSVEVKLFESGSTDTTYSHTNSEGFYAFYNIPPGDYVVEINVPYGYLPVDQRTQKPVSIIKGTSKAIDFQLIELASVSGTIFLDANGNGKMDNTERGLPNQKVYLEIYGHGKPDTLTSNSSGEYTFYSVPKGKGKLKVILPEMYYQMPADTAFYSVDIVNDTLNATHLTSNNFGLLEKVVISGQVFIDLNGDGEYQLGDSLLQDYEVFLIDPVSNDTTKYVTDSKGHFVFSQNVLEAQYQMKLVPKNLDIEYTGKKTKASPQFTFGPISPIAEIQANSFYLFDLNNDHQVDNIGSTFMSNAFTKTWLGTIKLTPPSEFENGFNVTGKLSFENYGFWGLLAGGDFNNDGYNDIGAMNYTTPSTQYSFFIGEGKRDSMFGKKIKLPLSDTVTLSNLEIIHPIHKDTVSPPDIAMYGGIGMNNIIYYLANDGSGNFTLDSIPTEQTNIPDKWGIINAMTGDFIGSPLEDILLFILTIDGTTSPNGNNILDGNLWLIENKGNRQFVKGIPIANRIKQDTSLEYQTNIIPSDLNQDGKLDIVLLNDSLYYSINQGLGNFSSLTPIPNSQLPVESLFESGSGPSLSIPVTADMDKNGFPDIVAQTDTNKIKIFYNQNGTQFTRIDSFSLPSSLDFTGFLDVGDFNLDGLMDIAYVVPTPDSNKIATIINQTTFAPSFDLAVETGNNYSDLNFSLQNINAIAPSLPVDTLDIGTASTSLPQGDRWIAGNMVRYAVSFYSENKESFIGPWTEWQKFTHAMPKLTNIPIGPAATKGRKIYRQFWRYNELERAGKVEVIHAIHDNTTTTYQDNNK